jgi:hypothetical protein
MIKDLREAIDLEATNDRVLKAKLEVIDQANKLIDDLNK